MSYGAALRTLEDISREVHESRVARRAQIAPEPAVATESVPLSDKVHRCTVTEEAAGKAGSGDL